jgi:hypothetical protein
MKEGAVIDRLLACLGGQIMRYFRVLEPGRQTKPPLLIADRALWKTLLGKAHSAKVDTGFA